MSLQIGIVGLPNVGKSTLFNALLKKQQALAANYPFATIEPNVGVVPVPDERLGVLAEMVVESEGVRPPARPATVEFLDIAGLVAGAHKGEGLGNKFLAHIREVDAVCFVVRAFDAGDVVETGSGDFGEDLLTVKTELVMADLETLENQKEKVKRQNDNSKLKSALEKLDSCLSAGNMASEAGLNEEERQLVRELHLLTMKPAIYVVNVSEDEIQDSRDKVQEYAERLGVDEEQVVVISAKMEAEVAALSTEEQQEYLRSVGLQEPGLVRLVQTAYVTLDLISFLTAGEKEVRAWTVRRGTGAQEAAGVIHSDFAKEFIKAEVIDWQDLVQVGGWKRAREQGLVRQEGREYQVEDGDVVEFKHGG